MTAALPQFAFDEAGCLDCGAAIESGWGSRVPGGLICDPCARLALNRLERLAHAAGRAGTLYTRRCKSRSRFARAIALGSQWAALRKRLREVE